MAYIEVKDLKKHYTLNKPGVVDGKKVKKQKVKAIDGISFEIETGQTVGVIGESGCGKSTLGRVLVGLDSITEGEVLYHGKSSEILKKEDRLGFHRTTQMVFQNPFDTFDSRHTIKKILMSPLKLHSIGNNDEERLNIIIKALEDGGIKPATQFLERYPHQLSGGQLQRISIIRAMLLKPKFLIADEPVSMLDVSVRADIIKMMQELTEKEGTTLVFISHDISTTQHIADKLIVMYYGKIVEQGKTNDIIHDPQHEYTKLLLKSVGSIDPSLGKRKQRERAND